MIVNDSNMKIAKLRSHPHDRLLRQEEKMQAGIKNLGNFVTTNRFLRFLPETEDKFREIGNDNCNKRASNHFIPLQQNTAKMCTGVDKNLQNPVQKTQNRVLQHQIHAENTAQHAKDYTDLEKYEAIRIVAANGKPDYQRN